MPEGVFLSFFAVVGVAAIVALTVLGFQDYRDRQVEREELRKIGRAIEPGTWTRMSVYQP